VAKKHSPTKRQEIRDETRDRRNPPKVRPRREQNRSENDTGEEEAKRRQEPRDGPGCPAADGFAADPLDPFVLVHGQPPEPVGIPQPSGERSPQGLRKKFERRDRIRSARSRPRLP